MENLNPTTPNSKENIMPAHMIKNIADWRSTLKARFSDRAWVIVALSEINPTISSFEAQGIDCSSYKTFVEMNGVAWIRFSGPRIVNGQQMAAFEVRTEGSTQDHPKQLHLIPVADLDEVVLPLGGTPRSLGLEPKQSQQLSPRLKQLQLWSLKQRSRLRLRLKLRKWKLTFAGNSNTSRPVRQTVCFVRFIQINK